MLGSLTMTKLHWLAGMIVVGVLVAGGAYVLPKVVKRSEPVKRVNLKPSANDVSSLPPRTDKLRIAVAAIVSPAKSLVFYEDIFDYIGEQLGQEVEMVQRKTYAEVNDLMEDGHIDAAFVCSRPYVEGRRDFGMELLCVPECSGKTEYYSYFIVHKDSPIRELNDLRGKVFAFSDRKSNTGMLVPTFTFAKMGQTPDSFFRKYIFTYSHDNSILSVAKKQVDAAAVDSLIWEYFNVKEPSLTAQTKIIHRSAPFAIPPVVVSPGIADELKEKLRSAFLSMHENARGREILRKVMIDRFTMIDDSAYDSIREMEAFVKAFMSQR